MIIHETFPTVIVEFDYNDFLESERNELLNVEYKSGLFTQSVDTYILKNYAPNLYSWIKERINEYSQNVLATRQLLKITNSWLVKHTNEKQLMPRHAHANSIISGAFYVNAPQGTQGIQFHKDDINTSPYVYWEKDRKLSESNPWVHPHYYIPVATGKLVLFPSQTMHSVAGKEIKEERCVLSFNTWFVDPVGSHENLNYLGQL
jgi:hypothetical protein